MTPTPERRDIASEHITLEEQALLCQNYGIKPAAMTTLVRELAETNIWNNIGREKNECLICGQIIDGQPNAEHRNFRNTNFGRTSHGKKHINDGTALNRWGGADGVFILPSRRKVVEEIERKRAQHFVDKELPKLREERKPYAAQRRQVVDERNAFERSLIELVRTNGVDLFGSNARTVHVVKEIKRLTLVLNEINATMKEIEAKYDKKVVGQLTLGDG